MKIGIYVKAYAVVVSRIDMKIAMIEVLQAVLSVTDVSPIQYFCNKYLDGTQSIML